MHTNDTGRRTILVTGATGAQGGGVARHLLRRGRFRVRALTRSPRSDEARALRDLGAEIVRGNLYDTASVREALDDCWGAFGVTNFWEHFEGEYEQGINLVDAVADSGVRHFVFSTQPHVERITGGDLRAAVLDLKAQVEQYARELDLPATYVHPSYYYDNFLTFFVPQPQADGSLRFGFPLGDAPLAAVAAEDIGGAVAAIFERRDEFLGRSVHLVGDYRPAADYAAAMARATGRPVMYRHVPREVFARYRFPGARDMADMFEYYRTRAPDRSPDLVHMRELYSQVRTFDMWLQRNAARLESVIAQAAA